LIAIGAAVPARSSRRFGIAKHDDTVDALAHLIPRSWTRRDCAAGRPKIPRRRGVRHPRHEGGAAWRKSMTNRKGCHPKSHGDGGQGPKSLSGPCSIRPAVPCRSTSGWPPTGKTYLAPRCGQSSMACSYSTPRRKLRPSLPELTVIAASGLSPAIRPRLLRPRVAS
jgi:hypothetical protein